MRTFSFDFIAIAVAIAVPRANAKILRELKDFAAGVAERAELMFKTGSRLSKTLADGGLVKLVEIHRVPHKAPHDCPEDVWIEGLMQCIDSDESQSSLQKCLSCVNIEPFRKCKVKLSSYLGFCEACSISSISDSFLKECRLCVLSPNKLWKINKCNTNE